MKRFLPLLLLAAATVDGSTLPGFRVQLVGAVPGFITALAADSHGTLYYSTRDGDVVRFGTPGVVVGHVPTHGEGNSGLIGMTLRDDRTAVVHYTTPNQTYYVVSSIDLTTGRETELHRFLCDITPGGETRGSSTEHHGGNLFAARDGSVFLGIGDYGIGFLAPDPAWNAGKMWRVLPDGSAKLFAKGFRNPFDLAWDEVTQRVIITDNGDVADDEIDVIAEGDDAGWPFTAGRRAAPEGTAAPVYSFASVVAPTGLAQLGGRNPILRSGYLLGAYVTKAIYYIPDIYARPLPDPIAVVKGESDPVIDVIETQDGSVYFATMTAIYQLIVPLRGDCNGDGLIDALDVSALAREIAEGPHAMVAAQGGANRGSWGCDVNGDGVIDTRDAVALGKAVRTRATRVR